MPGPQYFTTAVPVWLQCWLASLCLLMMLIVWLGKWPIMIYVKLKLQSCQIEHNGYTIFRLRTGPMLTAGQVQFTNIS